MYELEYNPIQEIKIYNVYEFYDEPIVFSFYNSLGSLFLANYVDWEEEKDTWLYLPVTLTELRSLEDAEITIRELLLNATSNIAYIAEEAIGRPTQYFASPIESLNAEFLPTEDSFIQFSRKTTNLGEIELIADKVTSSNRYIIDISLETNGTHENEIEAVTLGNTLIDFQGFVEAVSLDQDATTASRIPIDIREKSKFKVTDTYAASFGVRLESEIMASLVSEGDLLNNSLVKIMELLTNSDNTEVSQNLLSQINKKSVDKYKTLISNLSKSNLDGRVTAAFPRTGDNVEVTTATFTSNSLARLSDIIDSLEEESNNNLRMFGVLVSYNSETRLFKFLRTEEGMTGSFVGRISEEMPDQTFEIPSSGTVEILERIVRKVLTGEEQITYRLLSWQPYMQE